MPKLKIIILMIFFVLAIEPFTLQCSAKQNISEQTDIETYANLDWWQKFNDPYLSQYIIKAIDNNKDIKISTFKVLEEIAKVRETFGKELPQVTALDNYLRLKAPALQPGKVSQYENLFTTPVFASYEADFWQRNRNYTQQEEQRLKISKQDQRTNYITITTETASAYFNIVRLDKLICLQNKLLEIIKQDYDIKLRTYNTGLIPCNDVVLAKKNISEAAIQLKSYEKQLELFINELYVLTGESPEQTRCIARNSIDEINLRSDLPCEISSERILLRPDILKAEDNLKIAKIDISIARKDFLPDIYIFGLISYNSAKLLNMDHFLALLGASSIEKIYTGGQRHAKLRGKKYSYEELFQNYQKTILTSLQQVNDSLVTLKSDICANNDYIDKITLESQNLYLLDVNYKKGLSAYLDTIQSQKTLIGLEQEQVNAKTDCLIDTLNLYKALGGAL